MRHHCLGIAQIPEGNVISFNRLHKAFGHPIRLRALHRRGEGSHVDSSCKGTCLSGGVATAGVRDPLNRARRSGITPKALLDGRQHHVLNQASIDAFGGSNPADRLSVTAVESKSDPDFLFVPAANLKAVRALAQIALINRHPIIMSPGVSRDKKMKFVSATIIHLKNLKINLLKKNRNSSVCLTGGQTARLLYESAQFQVFLLNHFTHFFWGDERLVPPTNSGSNYLMAKQTLLRMSFSKAKIFRIKGEAFDPEEEMRRYGDQLPASFDLVLLSVGDDGHIASIFKGSSITRETSRPLAYVANAPGKFEKRITITPKVLLSARDIVVLVRGKTRGRLMADALQVPLEVSTLPVRLTIGRTWIMDEDAYFAFKAASCDNLYGTTIICA